MGRRRISSQLILLVIAAGAVPACGGRKQGSVPGPSGPAWVWQNPRPQGNLLMSIAFANSTDGWAVGYSGALLRTVDGGTTWTPQPDGGSTDLQGVAVIKGTKQGWIVGSGGRILHTTDGATWTLQNSGVTQQLLGVTFADVLTGWA
ncbi:MAG TPA: YCF48-related protein, partial [Planctomycetota bacterium]|nr:YCF48-related protein [Planctomycetota bacterium]